MPQGIWLVSYVILWLLLGMTTILLVATMRQVRQFYSLYVKTEPSWGLPIGALAPQVTGTPLYSDTTGETAAEFLPEKGKLNALFFVSPGCTACQAVLPQLGSIGRAWKQANHYLIVSTDTTSARRYVSPLENAISDGEVNVLSDATRATIQRYNVQSVPYLVVVGKDGKVCAKGSAATRNEIDTTLKQAEAMFS